jgi:hypothetical protein
MRWNAKTATPLDIFWRANQSSRRMMLMVSDGYKFGRPGTIVARTIIVVSAFVLACAAACYGSHEEDDARDTPGADADVDADGGSDDSVVPPTVPAVDILVLVDYSSGMAQEQAALTSRFPGLLDELVNPSDADGDGRPDHPAVTDIHVGVISQDVGSGGLPVTTCLDEPFVGDNGCLLHSANPLIGGCNSSYPVFLAYDSVAAPTYSVENLGEDLACIATIGDSGPDVGCGFEQPLASVRRATTDNVSPGGCNDGLLRPDSLLVLIILTDEDDCSVLPDHPEMFDQERADLGHLNIRCFLHPEFVEPVEDFVAALRALRTRRPDRLVVGMLVAVPPDAPQCAGSGDSLGECLSVPAMHEQIDPARPTQLIPSCNTTMGIGMPPVRLVRMAQQFGDTAYVGSSCATDYRDTLRGITQKIVGRLGP